MTTSQRWRNRVDSYRPEDDDRFDPLRHAVVPVVGEGADGAVRPFVSKHHYSGGCPNASSHRFLLIDERRPSWSEENAVVGVAVFGSPSGPPVIRSNFPFLANEPGAGVELQRLVLLDEVKRMGESWFVSQCKRWLKRETPVRGIVSFADPTAGHNGCVYQALDAWYTGTSEARSAWFALATGRRLNRRHLTKIRASCSCPRGSGKSTSGAPSYVGRLVELGARPPRGPQECLHDWLDEILPGMCEQRRHPGCHRYLWGLDKTARRALRRIHGDPDPGRYPKRVA